jgi:serine/threonine protein kinase
MKVHGLEYAYRLKTSKYCGDLFRVGSIKEEETWIDLFILNDFKFKEFKLYENVWRETLLLNVLSEESVLPVSDFGQIGETIYRMTEPFEFYTLGDYIEDKIQKANFPTYSTFDSAKPREEERRDTLMPEFEVIKLAIRIIDLLELLHSKQIIHSNLNPYEIFLPENDLESELKFNSLYHCIWEPQAIKYEETRGSIHLFDL